MTPTATAFLLLLVATPTQAPRAWEVDGAQREALVFVPTKSSDRVPVVFAFHGHGGTMRNAARSFRYQELWPEAIVVYMQGLPTKGITDPEGKKPGWQRAKGESEDRDLKFFDAVFATLKKDHPVDESRVYATGHSNGGGFTYLLWAARGEHFAALAPSSCGTRSLVGAPQRPVLHVAGEKDALVSFENQKAVLERVRKHNGCEGEGKSLGHGQMEYPSPSGASVVALIHPGGHAFPESAPKTIVEFFKRHWRK